MAIYSYFIRAFQLIISRFNWIEIMPGAGLLSLLVLINIVYIMFVIVKRMTR